MSSAEHVVKMPISVWCFERGDSPTLAKLLAHCGHLPPDFEGVMVGSTAGTMILDVDRRAARHCARGFMYVDGHGIFSVAPQQDRSAPQVDAGRVRLVLRAFT